MPIYNTQANSTSERG